MPDCLCLLQRTPLAFKPASAADDILLPSVNTPPSEGTKWYQTLLISQPPHCFSPLPPRLTYLKCAIVFAPCNHSSTRRSSPNYFFPVNTSLQKYLITSYSAMSLKRNLDSIDKMFSVTLTGQQHARLLLRSPETLESYLTPQAYDYKLKLR